MLKNLNDWSKAPLWTKNKIKKPLKNGLNITKIMTKNIYYWRGLRKANLFQIF